MLDRRQSGPRPGLQVYYVTSIQVAIWLTFPQFAPLQRSSMSRCPRFAVLMDPIGQINPAKDSTLAMMLAAQRRGIELSWFGQADLAVRDGQALARLRPVSVSDDPACW